jgi:hypothetical protein
MGQLRKAEFYRRFEAGAWLFAKEMTPGSPAAAAVGSWKTAQEQAQGFNDLFVLKHRLRGTTLDEEGRPKNRTPVDVPLEGFPVVPIAPSEVVWALQQSNQSRCVDAGGMSLPLLRLLPQQAIEVLAALMTLSLRFAAIPDGWRTAVVTPLLKPGKNPSDPNSYRPARKATLVPEARALPASSPQAGPALLTGPRPRDGAV